MIVYIKDKKQKELISSTILADLPDWFGLPNSTAEYVKYSQELPFWAEIENDTAKGFIALKGDEAAKINDLVYLGVGVHSGYGAAHRMYVKRGYIPDGSGVWYQGKQLGQYAQCCNDDDLLLFFSKNLTTK